MFSTRRSRRREDGEGKIQNRPFQKMCDPNTTEHNVSRENTAIIGRPVYAFIRYNTPPKRDTFIKMFSFRMLFRRRRRPYDNNIIIIIVVIIVAENQPAVFPPRTGRAVGLAYAAGRIAGNRKPEIIVLFALFIYLLFFFPFSLLFLRRLLYINKRR